MFFRDSSANLEKEGKVSSLMNDHKSKVMNSIHWKKESRQLFIFVLIISKNMYLVIEESF